MQTVTGLLDRMLDPVSQALNPEAARLLLDIRADEQTQRTVEDLADRNSEGQLSDEEKSLYEALVAASELISVLQAKARTRLSGGITAA